jgi:hypothetical protein
MTDRKLVGRAALDALRDHPNEELTRLTSVVMSVTGAKRWEAEQALKSRVTIGRCWNHGRTRWAYWWPRSEGRLSDTDCPLCGRRLSQTTLALDAPFYRIGEVS